MKPGFALIPALLCSAALSHGQVIDRYGINIGASYATQDWKYKVMPYAPAHDYRFGLQSFLSAEKDLWRSGALRAELGYVQKGFKDQLRLVLPDGSSPEIRNKNVVLHDLALDIGLKLKPALTSTSLYALIGFRGDYLITYKDIEFEEPASGRIFHLYESTISKFNKLNLGGLIGVGIDIGGLIYVEGEYNPSFTANFDDPGLRIKDDCWGAKIGLYLSKLLE